MNFEPVTRATRIADGRVNPPVLVPAALTRNFTHARLTEIEAAWAPARRELADALRRAGATLENRHWNWTNKVDRVERGELVLHAIECEGEIQGLMATQARPRAAILTTGHLVVYVDYLEAAPWNQHAPDHPARFGGVGKILMGDAIYLSLERGLRGRVGLHSLTQAEGFYQRACRLAHTGRDPNYHDLVYFEYTEEVAAEWLANERARQ